jgi:Na+/melibiose symporter-like transporter
VEKDSISIPVSAATGRKDPYDIDFTSTTASLSWYDKIVHTLYAAYSFNVSWVIFGYYLVYFYTDIVGLSPILAGAILLVSRIADCFTDLLVGYLMDNVCFKWGRYRTWSMLGMIPLLLLFVGVFTALPVESVEVKIAWAGFCYGCFGAIGATLSFMPAIPQLVNMTKNPKERETLAVLKSLFYNIAQIVAASAFMPLVNIFGGNAGDQAQGFFWAALIIGLSAMVFQFLNIRLMKKFELNRDGTIRDHLKQMKHEPTLTQIKSVATNRPAVVLISGQILQQIMCAIKNGVIIYIFIYYLSLEGFYAIAMLANTISMVAGVLLLKPLIRMFKDTNRAYLFSMIASAVTSIMLFFFCQMLGADMAAQSMQYGLLFLLLNVNGMLTGAYVSFIQIMIPMTIDFGEWQNGNGQAGMVSSMNGFCITIGAALGAQLFGGLLDFSGYVANTDQSNTVLTSMLALAFIVPAVITILHFLLQHFYGLTDRRMSSCMQDIKQRNLQKECV